MTHDFFIQISTITIKIMSSSNYTSRKLGKFLKNSFQKKSFEMRHSKFESCFWAQSLHLSKLLRTTIFSDSSNPDVK
jgi:hypothetical protein